MYNADVTSFKITSKNNEEFSIFLENKISSVKKFLYHLR